MPRLNHPRAAIGTGVIESSTFTAEKRARSTPSDVIAI